MRVSHLFLIALFGGILCVILARRGPTDESETNTDRLQAAKAYVPRGAGVEWTEDGDLNFSLRFPPASREPKHSRNADADASEREERQSNPYSRVPD